MSEQALAGPAPLGGDAAEQRLLRLTALLRSKEILEPDRAERAFVEAEQLERGVIEEEDGAAGIGQADEVGRGFDDAAQPAALRLVGPGQRDVTRNGEDPLRPSVRSGDGRDGRVPPAQRAIQVGA